jgi:aconitate hydratase
VGVKLKGTLPEGSTPTDLVLAVTELLRSRDVVAAFVEYFGDGYVRLSVPDRATLGNMSPEYGATMGFCPVDSSTLSYLAQTGRDPEHVSFVENYSKLQGLFVLPDAPEPRYNEILEIDLAKIEPSIAGPRNPEERKSLRNVPSFMKSFVEERNKIRTTPVETEKIADNGFNFGQAGNQQILVQKGGSPAPKMESLTDGSIIIAAITSCTNTSNPTVMIGAGLLAKNAVTRGLSSRPYIKCSLAPGSSVVKDYLERAGLLFYLDKLGFNLVGYGCTTCIGNSGPLAPEIESEIKEKDLYAVAVLSGNRNFDGRIHPLAKGSFLMSPMLVVAYALVGRMDFDFSQPIGTGTDGRPVYLVDIWPSLKEIQESIRGSVSSELYKIRYSNALVGDDKWQSLLSTSSDTFPWNESSTYIREPPWFQDLDDQRRGTPGGDMTGARALLLLGDKVTTDHISPAGTIPLDSPAGRYLVEHGVPMIEFSTYGSRRGNHEVMVRGGFSNIRLKNYLADGREGGYTKYLPTGEIVPIFDAAQRYIADGTPLIILAGKQYGTGSSRDWAAKATKLLGVKAVIAESFERIHRSNLVAMGVLPLEFAKGENTQTLGLRGDETYSIAGLDGLKPGASLEVTATSETGEVKFKVRTRIDNRAEMSYYNSGGVLPYVFRLYS